MKKILVLSDSHGNVNNMVTAVGRLHPDMIIHLGDCWADAEQLHRKFPMTVMEQVPGHTFNVKAGYLNLEYAAEERKVDAALFGHTHRVFYDKHNRIAYMNPGSIGQPPYGIPPSYGILQVDGSSNTIATDVIYLEENN